GGISVQWSTGRSMEVFTSQKSFTVVPSIPRIGAAFFNRREISDFEVSGMSLAIAIRALARMAGLTSLNDAIAVASVMG
ncbi:hypothetical protein ACC692_37265, partial [Rhizobium ruizarguesonis]